MRNFVRFWIITAGVLSLLAAALAIAVSAFPEFPQSQSVRQSVLAAVQRWAGVAQTPLPVMQAASSAKTRLYQCSMHPQIISDKPELCPICGMRLEPVEENQPPAQASTQQRKL